ncbi:MAG: hypothetical protein H0T84_15180 [Tatlockia sp.]|nr:hypothetical protein [Tatlockia sp.]
MFVRIRAWLLNLKDNLQAVLLYVRSHAEWLRSFNSSPIGLIIKPIFSITLLALAFMQAYNLYEAKQFDVEKILFSLATFLSAGMNNVSTFGGIAAAAMHISFAAGPWFLLSSMIIGLTQQTGMLIFHCYKAYFAIPGSTHRMHHLQAAMHNIFNGFLIVSMMMTVVFALLSPGAPAVLATFTILGISMLVTNFLWRNISSKSRQDLKHFFGFGKPENDLVKAENSLTTVSVDSYQKICLPIIKPARRSSGTCLGFWTPEVEDNDTSAELQSICSLKI